MAIEFDVVVPDRPGELGRLARTLSEKGVNIDAIAACTGGGKGYVSLLLPEGRRTRDVLRSAGYEYVEKTVLTVTLDRPARRVTAQPFSRGSASRGRVWPWT